MISRVDSLLSEFPRAHFFGALGSQTNTAAVILSQSKQQQVDSAAQRQVFTQREEHICL